MEKMLSERKKKASWSRVRNQVGQAGNFYKETNTKEGEKERQVVECSAKLQSQEGKCYTKAKHKERLTSKTRRQTKGKDESKRGQLACCKGLKNIHILKQYGSLNDLIVSTGRLFKWAACTYRAGSITEVLCFAAYFI